jgi:hypothetical protein
MDHLRTVNAEHAVIFMGSDPEIDENLIRRDLSRAVRVCLTTRWEEITRQIDEAKAAITAKDPWGGKVSQRGTGLGGRGKKDKAPGSLADLAQKTGRSKSSVDRDLKLADGVGRENLPKIIGTSLDSGAEMEALAALHEPERVPLVERAAAGEKVSAVAARQWPTMRGDLEA